MTKILVTGHAGVIGRVLVNKLIERGYTDITGADMVYHSVESYQVKTHQVDLSKTIPSEFKDGFDVVFHLAAIFGRLHDSPWVIKANFDNNVLLSHKLIDEVPTDKFVFASSYLVYKYDYDGMQWFSEDSPIGPRNYVGAAKYFTENELLFNEIDHISARIFRVYGLDSKDVIGRFIRKSLRGYPVEVYNANSIYSYIYADDVAEGLIQLWQTGSHGIFNLGHRESKSIQDVVKAIADCGVDIKAELRIKETYTPLELTGCSLYRTPYEPQIDLETGIERIVEYERARL